MLGALVPVVLLLARMFTSLARRSFWVSDAVVNLRERFSSALAISGSPCGKHVGLVKHNSVDLFHRKDGRTIRDCVRDKGVCLNIKVKA